MSNDNANAEAEEKNITEFQKLTPTARCEKMDVYNRAFHYIFSEDDIWNVAISGPYGCGKSSVLETWKRSEEGQEKTFVHISLAHFSQDQREACGER